jgi:hypothetical protein
VRLSGNPVVDIMAIGRDWGVRPGPPRRVERVADRSARGRRKVAAAVGFIGRPKPSTFPVGAETRAPEESEPSRVKPNRPARLGVVETRGSGATWTVDYRASVDDEKRPSTTELNRLARGYANMSGLVERHEAGHALVARELGYPVDYVEVGRTGVCGVTRTARPISDSRDAAMVLVAGCRAETTHPWWDDRMRWLWDDGDDERQLRAFDSPWLRAELETLAGRVDDLLLDQRRALNRVAAALETHRRLGPAELEALR